MEYVFGSAPSLSLQLTTALPQGNQGYEEFVRKGSCRKCGVTAYGKRKCERCARKFCATCAPSSLQKYGPERWEECCIGCEPCLVVVLEESEPILELEPESEDVVFFPPAADLPQSTTSHSPAKRGGDVGPLHVPFSATFATDDDDDILLQQYRCQKGMSLLRDSDTDDVTESETEEGEVLSLCGTFLPFARLTESPHDDNDTEEEEEEHRQQPEPELPVLLPPSPRTPTTPKRTSRIFDHANFVLEPPITPHAGCCTACQTFSTNKRPCSNCGTKYCHETTCLSFLYEDGTCAKCRPSPREIFRNYKGEHDMGCCTVCRQFARGKRPCETCGAKFCGEVACQAHLFTNGTCVVCHGEQ
ncbi:expressed unknown protein [Seminavis robusta]|uniref:Uncharacterized protein n=1 Tax=Seminavis robusta TaxID=568900 RepID=A0A9N8DMQ9_9STRA|nr:expressed unknown protein [Seminavis robusta]|eukprot:Sro230_g093200.1 n/a (359) ;mRNA; f:2476-3552